MADIPLNSLRTNKSSRAGYNRLGDDTEEDSGTTQTHTRQSAQTKQMRRSALTAANASRRNGKLRKGRYADDPVEEAGLLGAEDYQEEHDERGELISDDASVNTQVCSPLPFE